MINFLITFRAFVIFDTQFFSLFTFLYLYKVNTDTAYVMHSSINDFVRTYVVKDEIMSVGGTNTFAGFSYR